MNARRSVKWWGRILVIMAIALLGGGLWIGFPSLAAVLTGQPGPNSACNSQEPVLLAPIASIASLTDDGRSLYWLTRGDPGVVMKMSKSSGKMQVLADLSLDPYGILMDDKSVFWVDGTWDPGPSFTLKEVSKQGGAVTELWRTQGSMTQLSMDADYLYWLDYEARTLFRLSRQGGEPEALVSGLEGLNFFTLMNGQIYLGGTKWLGTLETGSPRILVTADRLLQDLHIGLRDERSVYYVGPVIGDFDDGLIFVFYVGNNPGMVSCSDNADHIVSLPGSGAAPHIILSVAGSISHLDAVAPYLYLIGDCGGGRTFNFDSGESSYINIGYDAFNLIADKNHLYWTDREGLKCMRRPVDE